MKFRILGPMEVAGSVEECTQVAPRAAKLRVVLATLLVRANEVVSVDGLIDELWGDSPPRTATTTLQVYISQLRKLLHRADPRQGRDALITRQPGYVLRVERGQLDLTDFEELHEQGRQALEWQDHSLAADLSGRALALWRGPLLSDTPHGPLLDSASVRMAEVRMATMEQRIRADLHLGRHHDLIGELQAIATEHPLREELHAHLMVALYRAGRQAEALRVFVRVRKTLVDELAIEPGPALQRLHQRILAGDSALLRPVAPPPAPPQVSSHTVSPELPVRFSAALPAVDPSFVGRTAVLTEIERLLREAPAGASVAVAGASGVGKTALAVEAAHRAADAFPDGQIFLDLQSEPGRPLGPTQAMARLLRRAGTRGPLPADPDELLDLVHRLLSGRRALLLLDNAVSEAQIRPLLPTTSGSTALITSRRIPAGLHGIRSVLVDVLSHEDAVLLFGNAVGKVRAAGELEAVSEVVELCGHLPLAVRIAAAQLAARPHWNVASLATRLRGEHSRLSELSIGDLDVRGTLLVAYQESSSAERRAFRMLGLLPAGRFDLWVAAAVLGVPLDEAERVVEGLVDGRLVEADSASGPCLGRYRLHGLLRVLAVERLAQEEHPESIREATRRMCEAYTQVTGHADALLTPGRMAGVDLASGAPVRTGRSDGGAQRLADRLKFPAVPHPTACAVVDCVGDEASTVELTAGLSFRFPAADIVGEHPLEWFAEEQQALVEVAMKTHAAQLWRPTLRLVDSMTGGLEARAAWDDWDTTHTLALDSARRCGDRSGEARLLRSLGDLAWQRRRLDEAGDYYGRARLVAEEAADQREYGRALVGLAELHLDHGATDDAARLLAPALAAVGAPDDARGRYDAVRARALLALQTEGPQAAERWFGECLELAAALRDRRLEAYARRAMREARAAADGAGRGRAGGVEVRPGVWRLGSGEGLPSSA